MTTLTLTAVGIYRPYYNNIDDYYINNIIFYDYITKKIEVETKHGWLENEHGDIKSIQLTSEKDITKHNKIDLSRKNIHLIRSDRKNSFGKHFDLYIPIHEIPVYKDGYEKKCNTIFEIYKGFIPTSFNSEPFTIEKLKKNLDEKKWKLYHDINDTIESLKNWDYLNPVEIKKLTTQLNKKIKDYHEELHHIETYTIKDYLEEQKGE